MVLQFQCLTHQLIKKNILNLKVKKVVVVFHLLKSAYFLASATGAAVALDIDVSNTHDIKLARKIYQNLNPGDVVLGDRAFCAYADIVNLKNQDCDGVFRKHQSRKTEMRKGKIVGSSDKLITWNKKKKCPSCLSQSEFDSLPTTLVVREICYYIEIPGFRTKQVILITTLLDQTAYSTIDIINLYEERWTVEVNLKHLKTTLGMDILRGKTPSLVRKEIWAFLLVYNLLRTLMFEAGSAYNVSPLRLSLQGTRNHLKNFIPNFLNASKQNLYITYQTLLKIIIHQEIPERPGRSEPRVKSLRSNSKFKIINSKLQSVGACTQN